VLANFSGFSGDKHTKLIKLLESLKWVGFRLSELVGAVES
jgi:hypothetical protein